MTSPASLSSLPGAGGGGGAGPPGSGGDITGQADGMSQAVHHDLQTQLMTLKHHHQIRQQLLMQQYQEQQLRLASEHESQVQEHLKVQQSIQEVLMLKKQQAEYEANRERMEEQQRAIEREQEKIELLKNKKKEDQSAIASLEVKAKLQEFVLNKKHREAHGGSLSGSPPQFRQWATQHSSLEGHSPPQGLSPPYKHRLLGGQYESDFPLRKTASEPNLKLRLALKQKMIDRRSSPLLRRRERMLASKRAPLSCKSLSLDTPEMCHSNPDSGPNTPPSNLVDPQPVSKELMTKMSQMVVNQSMPNIASIPPGAVPPGAVPPGAGVPTTPGGARDSPTGSDTGSITGGTAAVSGAELEALRARGAMPPYGIPPGQGLPPHMMGNPPPGAATFYPIRMMEPGEFSPGSSANPPGVFIPRQLNSLDESAGHPHPHPTCGSPQSTGASGAPPSGPQPPPPPPTMPYVTPKALPPPEGAIRPRLRHPLNRTHSAPLPLGPLLGAQAGLLLAQQQQSPHPPHPAAAQHSPTAAGQHPPTHPQQQQDQIRNQKLYVKQRIQSTVLQRAGSKSQMEHVDEETHAKLQQEASGGSPSSSFEEDKAEASHRSKVVGRAAFLHQQREMYHLNKHPLAPPPTGGMLARPLGRAQSSPAVTLPAGLNPSGSPDLNHQPHLTTGLAYDAMMLKHGCVCGNDALHPENPSRIQSIWTRLLETGLASRCQKIKCRKASMEELQLVHDEAYTLLYATSSNNRSSLSPQVYAACPPQFVSLPCGGVGVDSDTVWNEQYTSQATRTAVGSVVEMGLKVSRGELRNGMCIVRPPGHHAEHNQPMGFCYFNAIAVAARVLQEQLDLQRILIVDWDVHHGNSTQQMFYTTSNVLYISLHRHDNGNFFPGTGSPDECGADQGLGYNVNISWAGSLNPPMSDAEYLSAFRNIVMPIARRYDPQIVLVSSGFDAAMGHSAPLGGYRVSPTCFGHMTRQLMTLASGKVVLVLEGGYDISSICDSSEICVQALIDEAIPPIAEEELTRQPCGIAVETMQNTIKHHLSFWPVLQQSENRLHLSEHEWQSFPRKTLSRDESETVSAFASLSVVREDSPIGTSTSEPMEES